MKLKDALGGGIVGKLELWAINDPSVKKVVVPLQESVYADAGIKTGSFGLALMGVVPSFVVDGHYFGADKLGHFFDQGYDYYEAVYVKHGSVVDAFENMGLDNENGLNGMLGDGIRSYGDMAANFAGYLFWRDVVGGSSPYFDCQHGRYVRTARRFDWKDYVNDGWDEGLNCSEFNSLAKKSVDKALAKLGMRCPLNPAACQGIADLTCGYTFLSPACRPFVRDAGVPDSRCHALMKVDRSESSSCGYSPPFVRRMVVKDALDLAAGARPVVEYQASGIRESVRRIERSLRNIRQRLGQE
jgi:hypothetical protein